MNQNNSALFNKIFIIVCFVLGVIGIAVFAGSNFASNSADSALQGKVVIWGTLPESDMIKIFSEYSQIEKNITIAYTQIPENIFVEKFIENVAKDTAPDIVFAGENIMFPLRNYFYSFNTDQGFDEVSFRNLFVRSLYPLYGKNGVFTLPVAVDPLVMYVNLDILQNAGFNTPPKTWSDIPIFVKQVLELNKKNTSIEQKAIAFGSFSNVLYAKEILLTLLNQLDNQVLLRNFEAETSSNKTIYNEKYESIFGVKDARRNLNNQSSAESSFVFFSSFINPNLEDVYTWSKKSPIDRDLFATGNLGLYFGLSSDKAYIDAKNSHLNYEIALIPIPQAESNTFLNTSYAKVYSVGVTTKTKNLALSQKVLTDISTKEISEKVVNKFNMAPARSDLTSNQTDPFKNIVYTSAGRASFVLEPKFDLLKTVFTQISEALNASRLTPSEIISNAQEELDRQLDI